MRSSTTGDVSSTGDGVRSWDSTDNIGVQSTFTVIDWHAGDREGVYVVTLEVRGNGYNGSGPMTFELRDDHISALTIGP